MLERRIVLAFTGGREKPFMILAGDENHPEDGILPALAQGDAVILRCPHGCRDIVINVVENKEEDLCKSAS